DAAYGYQLGELRGVASVKIPTAKFDQRFRERYGANAGCQKVCSAGDAALPSVICLKSCGHSVRLFMSVRSELPKGDGATRPTIDNEDEICQLAGAFNQMAEGVQSREQALTKLSQAVEQVRIVPLRQDRICKQLSNNVNACFVENTGYSFEEA
ncbi:MAG: HAMP domain-containing protein, partial [Dechloromonas sp.]|nr:HAMP domain-containing protein [Candidatus Dechloromonas phosphorivorans]